MTDQNSLAREFEAHREHLRAVGFRMLGSTAEADDAVQETWLRLGRTDPDAVANLGGWLTTVLTRVCLDMLRARSAHREVPIDEPLAPPVADTRPHVSPEDEATLADSVGVAMMVVLDTLSPAERVTLVLHDMFGMPFDEIAAMLDRSPTATRQLASRARRRVQRTPAAEHDRHEKRRVVDAFLVASREGRFDDLLAVLAPDVVLRADAVAIAGATAAARHGAPTLTRQTVGAERVAEAFQGRALQNRRVLVDSEPGAAWAPRGTVRSVFTFTISGDRIVGIDVAADPATIAGLHIEFAA